MAQEPFSMISPLEQNRKLPKRLVMKVLFSAISPAWLSLCPTACKQDKHPHSCSSLLGFCEFSPKMFFFPVASVLFSFTLVPPDVLSTSNYFCLPKNRDWRVLWASVVRFTGWENTPKKHNERELAQSTLAVTVSHRILWAVCFSLQIGWCTF